MENKFNKSIDPQEVAKFSKIADEWWDPTGKFRPLHQINPLRINYIKQQIMQHFQQGNDTLFPLNDLNIIDIGCGGGILAEPIARLGANLTAIDASEQNIKVAKLHAEKMQLNIDYQAISIEQLASTGAKFDVVLNMEVIEHVADIDSFMQACCSVLKPGGLMFIATLNRTVKSYMLAIVGAEYILNWLPRGTHSWKKFLNPSEIAKLLRKHQLSILELKGMEYHLLKGHWYLSDNLDVNYLLTASKK
jgi:2-polyprenyl-6-hydroxyphenyl methylase/3-demethylubiquinone-9 3-methyltransferase